MCVRVYICVYERNDERCGKIRGEKHIGKVA